MAPSTFSPYYYTCFFFSQGILQAHATMDSSLSLCSPRSLLICLFSLVFSICFSILSFFTWVFLTWISGFISLLILLLLLCFLCYGLFLSVFSLMDIFFPPTSYLVLSQLSIYFNFLIPSLIPLRCSTFAILSLYSFPHFSSLYLIIQLVSHSYNAIIK